MATTETPTFEEMRAIATAEALLRTTQLSDLSFSPGYMADVHAGLAAAIGEEAARFALQLHRKTFFATAEGDDLDTLAQDHFGLLRQQGQAAIGEVVFSRPTTTAGNVSIPVGMQLSTADGTLFLASVEAVLTGTTLTVPIAAAETGDGGIVDVSTITVLVDSLTDTTVSVTNPERTAGGLTQESDADFRERVRGYLATVRRGTVSALSFGAKQVAGVLQAAVDESAFLPTVYIADSAGGANTSLVQAVQTELINWRTAGITASVVGATVLNQAIDISLTFRAGSDTAGARDAALAAIETAVNALGIGETLFESLMVTAAKSSDEGILNVVINNPAGDVVPLPNELIRTSTSLLTIT